MTAIARPRFEGTPADLVDDLAFAAALAETAGRILADRYERVEQVDFKGAKDIVTEVDHLSEALILDAIRAHDPDDAILSEETGAHDGHHGAPTNGRGRVWVVDPLDGTINYANGVPYFAVSIAMVRDGRPAIGVVHDPVRAETFAAAAGGPAFLNGRRIQAPASKALGDYVVSLNITGTAAARPNARVRKAVRAVRNMGSAALALAYVAHGRFDGFVQAGGLSLWDIAAAGLIAERGGAVVTDLRGGPWLRVDDGPQSISVLAAPPRGHAAFLALVRGDPLPVGTKV